MKIKKILLSSALSFGMLISAVTLAAGTSSEVAVKSDEYDYDTIYRISPLPIDFQPTIEYNGYTYTLTRHYFDYSIGFYTAIYTKVV